MPDTTALSVGMPPTSLRPDQRKELHALCNKLDGLRTAAGYSTAESFAKAAGHSVSTWHAWRRHRPTSPKFFDLRDFLRVVGLDLRVHTQADGAADGALAAGEDMTSETAEVVRLMETMPDEIRAQLRDAVHAKLAELVAGKRLGPPVAQ